MAGAGSVANVDGTVTIVDSTLSRNRAEDYGFGGGVSNKGGTVTITNSTLSGNRPPTARAGACRTSGGTLTITNSTLSGNCSRRFRRRRVELRGTVTLTGTLVSGNTAPTGTGVLQQQRHSPHQPPQPVWRGRHRRGQGLQPGRHGCGARHGRAALGHP